MNDFIKENKITLVVLIYLISVGLLFYFIVLPLQEKIVNKASDIQQEEIDQDITKKKITTVPVIEKDYQKYKENEESLNVMMEQSQEVEFIKELERLADETNNKIEFKIQEKKVEEKKKKEGEGDIKDKLAYTSFLSMQIALEGDYQDLLDFLYKLENYKNYVNILSVRLEKIELDSEKGNANPFKNVPEEEKVKSQEVLNSILDIVVYIKK